MAKCTGRVLLVPELALRGLAECANPRYRGRRVPVSAPIRIGGDLVWVHLIRGAVLGACLAERDTRPSEVLRQEAVDGGLRLPLNGVSRLVFLERITRRPVLGGPITEYERAA